MLKKYNDITVFETNKIDDMQDADIIKIVLPTSIENENKMKEIGFLFADRTLGVSIQLSKTELNFDKLIRLPIEETDGYKTEIEEIALKSFPYDRRFHLKLNYDDEELFKLIIKEWVNDLDNVLVAKYQSTVVGFLALKETDSDTLFVHFAAVDEKYRLTGAAMSLYAEAVKIAKDRGYKKLAGRISSKNTAVMNLYSYFGAHFENPLDIYIKEV
ncbi:GNAT family N-acetyltransferase [bacterium]|nr:GNAT family N-acetyltransferase [bacterium]